MNTKRVTLALAVAAIAGPVVGELRAQEFTLPPVPSSATEKAGTAFLPENGPCFYNPYSWMVRGAVNQSLLAAEMQDLAASGTSPGSGCLGHYAVTGSDLFGPWAYMLSDGLPQPERVSQARVKAVWDASRKAAAEERVGPRLGTDDRKRSRLGRALRRADRGVQSGSISDAGHVQRHSDRRAQSVVGAVRDQGRTARVAGGRAES